MTVPSPDLTGVFPQIVPKVEDGDQITIRLSSTANCQRIQVEHGVQGTGSTADSSNNLHLLAWAWLEGRDYTKEKALIVASRRRIFAAE